MKNCRKRAERLQVLKMRRRLERRAASSILPKAWMLSNLESLYVRSFDFSQNTNLYLTSRGSKDSGQQRMGLLSYQLTFKEMGYETPIETPDYLPAVLKLAATVQPDQMATVLTRAAGDITLLRGAAAESDENLKAYIALIDLVIDIAKAHERTVA